MITSKDNLRALPWLITSEDNLQDWLCLSNLLASPRFMLRQLVSLAMLELPLLRDLDLDHKLELHCSSLHKKCKSYQSNKKLSSKTYYLTNNRLSGNIFFLNCTQHHVGLHPTKPATHTGSQTEEESQGALPLSGDTNVNQHNHCRLVFWFILDSSP